LCSNEDKAYLPPIEHHVNSGAQQWALVINLRVTESIGARVSAYCCHYNGHDNYKESSIAQLLGINQVEVLKEL
jgi:hypothetical protein